MPVSNGHDNRDSTLFRAGAGNWEAFSQAEIGIDRVFAASEKWRAALKGISQPWLCWNVDDDWCLVQQRLVVSVGWIPIVGFDPRVGPPKTIVKDAVLIDFNDGFNLPTMFPHFPIEFAFLFTKKMAFWHSDLLVRKHKLKIISDKFTHLTDGEMAVTASRFRMKYLLHPRSARFWELIGCTTYGASKDQFDHGCGWWMNFYAHPNCPSVVERDARRKFYWDHGVGVKYWADRYKQRVHFVNERMLREGHCTQIKNNRYRRLSPNDERRDLSRDLSYNFELSEVCAKLGLKDLLS